MKYLLALLLITPVYAQTPIPPEQKAALEKYAELQKRKPDDIKQCDAQKVNVPVKHPATVLEEQAAEFAKCMRALGHYIP